MSEGKATLMTLERSGQVAAEAMRGSATESATSIEARMRRRFIVSTSIAGPGKETGARKLSSIWENGGCNPAVFHICFPDPGIVNSCGSESFRGDLRRWRGGR